MIHRFEMFSSSPLNAHNTTLIWVTWGMGKELHRHGLCLFGFFQTVIGVIDVRLECVCESKHWGGNLEHKRVNSGRFRSIFEARCRRRDVLVGLFEKRTRTHTERFRAVEFKTHTKGLQRNTYRASEFFSRSSPPQHGPNDCWP